MRSLFVLLPILLAPAAAQATRAKDLGSFHGIREVSLTGLGLVTGLQQTGDTQINRATVQAILADLAADGLVVDQQDLVARNSALVRLTATMRSDSRTGTRVDIRAASIGDARSLEGGVLEPSFLRVVGFADLQAFQVVAQGPLTVGGFNVEADGNQARRNVTNVGVVPDGGMVERELPQAFVYDELESIDFLLSSDNQDFTTAMRLADAVNEGLGAEIAEPLSASAVRLEIPEDFRGKFARFAATIEQIEVDPDTTARVVIDARTGTVVLGGKVSVRPFAIAHGGLKIEVGVDRQASQPGPFARGGETVIVENTYIGVDEEKGELVLVNAVSLADLVSALNAMGVKPRDLVVILQAVKDAGALDAELVLR